MGEKTNRGGVGFLGLLQILFIGLKLTGYIDWSWWWVLIPLWGGFAFFMGILLTIIILTIFSGFDG